MGTGPMVDLGGRDMGSACVNEPIDYVAGPYCGAATQSCIDGCTTGTCVGDCLDADPSGDCSACANINVIACANDERLPRAVERVRLLLPGQLRHQHGHELRNELLFDAAHGLRRLRESRAPDGDLLERLHLLFLSSRPRRSRPAAPSAHRSRDAGVNLEGISVTGAYAA